MALYYYCDNIMMLPTILILFITLLSGICAFTSPVQFIGSRATNYASNYEQSKYAQILQSTPIQQQTSSTQLYMVYAPPEDAEKVKSTKPKLPQPKVSFIVYL